MSISFGPGITQTISLHEATALALLLRAEETEAGRSLAAKLEEAAGWTEPCSGAVDLTRPEREAVGRALRELRPNLLPARLIALRDTLAA